MDVTEHMRRLEAMGFSGETLDRAIAAAGASRLAYLELIRTVEDRGMSPAEALGVLEPPATTS